MSVHPRPSRPVFEKPSSVADIHDQLLSILQALRAHREYVCSLECDLRDADDPNMPMADFVQRSMLHKRVELSQGYLMATADIIADKIAPTMLKMTEAEGESLPPDPLWPGLQAEVAANAKRPRVFA